MTSRFADMPEPPYYVVIFANQLSDRPEGYREMLSELEALAITMPGYIGRETARDDTGFGMAISYWEDEAALKNWKQQADHLAGQKIGKDRWYSHYVLRIAKLDMNSGCPVSQP